MHSLGQKHLFLAGVALFASPAVAETVPVAVSAVAADAVAAPAAEVPANGDIVVTALRRAERLQDVPVSVTALSGSMLKGRKIDSAAALTMLVPNLQANNTDGDGVPIFTLRGVAMNDFSLNQASPIAIYYDEVYKGVFPLLGVDLYDLERVEVLRGPQGTLYGKNTTGGAVNIISAKPAFKQDYELELGYGNYNRFESNGHFQTALTDTLAIRLAFTYVSADGWMKNLTPGQPDMNAEHQYGIRGSLLYQPTSDLSFVLRLSTSLQNPVNYGIHGEATAAGIGGGLYSAFGARDFVPASQNERTTYSEFDQHRRHLTQSASLTSTWQVAHNIAVTAVSSYDYGSLFIPEDADGSPLQVLEDTQYGTARQATQDVRITSSNETGFNFILGGFYSWEHVFLRNSYSYYTDLDVNGDGVLNFNDCIAGGYFLGCTTVNHFQQVKRSAAVYSDLSYKIGPVTLRGGLRFTHDTGEVFDYQAETYGSDGVAVLNTLPGTTVPNASLSAGFLKNQVTGKAGIDWKFSNIGLFYANYSKGYRGSSFAAQAFTPEGLTVVKPETLDAYEVGLKTQTPDRRFTANAALFYYNYKNQQANSVSSDGTQILVNLPKSRNMGGEIETQAKLTGKLSIHASAGYTSIKASDENLVQQGLLHTRANIAGGLDYEIVHLPSGTVSLSSNANWSTPQVTDAGDPDRAGYGNFLLVDARIVFALSDRKTTFSFWGTNITNKLYRTAVGNFADPFGVYYVQFGAPRYFGGTIDRKF